MKHDKTTKRLCAATTLLTLFNAGCGIVGKRDPSVHVRNEGGLHYVVRWSDHAEEYVDVDRDLRLDHVIVRAHVSEAMLNKDDFELFDCENKYVQAHLAAEGRLNRSSLKPLDWLTAMSHARKRSRD